MKMDEPMSRMMMEEPPIDLSEPSDNAQVVYSVRRLAAQAGFDEIQQTLIASAASELATNIIRYAGTGRITLAIMTDGEKKGLGITAEDDGPGITDIDLAMTENYSTRGGLGLGLPSVRRIMDEFHIRSDPETGTRIVVGKWK